MFLAAIMIVSVFAVPLAFSGAAAAQPNNENFHEEVTDGQTKYQGQILYADVSDYDDHGNEDFELRSWDTSDRQVGGLEESLEVVDSDYVIVDTEDLEAGNYIITNQSSGDDRSDEDIRFELVEQGLTVEFDDNTVADDGTDAETELEVSSRQRSTYAINVSVDGLDDEELRDVFTDGPDVEADGGLLGADRTDDVDNEFDIAGEAGETGYAMIDEDDEVLTIFNGEQNFDLNFTGVDAGEYEFEIEVVDSTATASSSITVEDRGDGEAVVSPADVFQGDIVEFVVELDNTDNAALVIGDQDDDGYQANVSITDADEDTISVFFNTYAAGNGSVDSDIIFSDDDADVVLENFDVEGYERLSAILDTGDYTVYAGAINTDDPDESDFFNVVDDPDEITTLTINDRSELDATQWRAGGDTVGDVLDELSDEDEEAAIELIGNAVENNLVTETDMFAVTDGDGSGDSDYQIHQVSASGLHGILAVADSESDLDDVDTFVAFAEALALNNSRIDGGLDEEYSVLFEFEQLNPGSNQQAIEISLNDIAENEPDGVELTDFIDAIIYDADANDYYIIIDTDDLISAADDLGADIEEDQEYEVTFAVQDARLLDETDDQDDLEDLYEEINWEFDLDEAEGDFLNVNSDGDVEAEAIEDAEVSVETNVAPGTELDIRVRNAPGTSPSFISNDRDVVVDVDGIVTGVFDFSSQSPDDEFEASVRQASFELEEDGVFIESEPVDDEDDVVDDEDDAVDDEDDVVDDEDDVVDDEDDSEDVDDETPGFGALVALVALLGAALLAARRQN